MPKDAAVIFGNADLRRLLFSYLRTSAYCACDTCGRVCQWDVRGRPLCSTMSYGGKTECRHCFVELEMERSMYSTEYL